MAGIDSVKMSYGLNNRVNFGNSTPIEASKTTAPVSVKETVDTFDKQNIKAVKPQVSKGKKIGTGIASFMCPGLGQAVNGQWGKAACYFFGSALLIPAAALNPWLGIVADVAIRVASIKDAVENTY